MVRVNQDVYVIPEDVTAIENYYYTTDTGISGSSCIRESGSVVVLKNGRKIYIKDLKAEQVYEKIYGPDAVRSDQVMPDSKT